MPVRTPAELFGPDAVSRTGAVRSPAAPLAVCLGACVLFGAAGGRAQEPEKPKSPPAPPVAGTAKPKSDPPPAPERWDELKLPPGAVIVVTKDGELARGVEGVFLSPEQYRQLTARLAQRQAAPAAPVIPSECHLQSQVSLRGPGGVARVRATFRVRTTEPGQVVFLGGRGARPASASLGEGKLPILLAGEEGLSVLVEEPGEHTVTVELQAKVVAKGAKGNELGYELSLPGSPITDLAQEAVPEVSSLRVGVREASPAPPGAAPGLRAPLQVERVDAQRLLPGAGGGPWPLGKAEYLEVSWEQPAPAAAGESPRTASAEVDVQVGETEVRATAVLRLTGSAREWKIWAPADAEVTAESGPAPGPGARAGVGEGASVGATTDFPFDEFPEIIRPADPREPVWTIRFEEPPASEVRVEVVTRVPRVANPQKGRGPFAIGPFAVEGVFPQPGEIRVTAPANLRVTCRPRGDVRRAEPPAGGAGEANGAPPARANRQAFRYQAPPADGKRRPVPPLQVEVQPIRGRVYTRTEHLLRLAEGGWYLRTEVRASPVRERVEMLELDVPAALQNIEASSPERELVEGVTAAGEAGPGHRRIQVRLAQARETDFVVRLEGFYPLKLTADEARFALPRPRGTFDERSEVAAVVPAGVNLRGSVRGSGAAGGWPSYPLEAARTSAAGGTEFRASLPGPPEEVRLSWRAQRPELPVAAEVDLVFRDGQAVLVHEVRFPAGPAVPRRLRLLGPRDLAGVRLLSPAGTIDRAAPGEWLVTLPASPEGNAPLRLSYAFALPPPPEGVPGPGAARRVEVPLLWVEAATRTETRVRVWGEESGGRILVPRPVGGDWHRQPTEVVPGRDALPLLVLVGGQA
ncbi:MAG TPA: hypothetical protein VIL46_13030, partial [Gemmataceae bacterium]